MTVYRKLVRDRIPDIIASTGRECQTIQLDEMTYKQELVRKLREESEEYFSAAANEEALEELADMLEVIRALAAVHGSSWEQLDAVREAKALKRGGFMNRVYLIEVDDER